jgi:hypothetical protein
MRPTIGAFLLFLSSPLLWGQAPAHDLSEADTDGPHVFYRGNDLVVKRIDPPGTSAGIQVREQRYSHRDDIVITCTLPETGDAFQLRLKKQLQLTSCYYPEAERILVISDIEGNFEALKHLLRAAGAIDAQFRWTFGQGHVVLLGDFFDRGLNVTEVLWLIYKLEDEAARAGGGVHYLLGNHEAMNLCGDHRYVRNKYPENARLYGEGYARWYDEHSELGRWLRTKNVILRIGPYVFCHGGISPAVAASGASFEALNDAGRRYLGIPFERITDPTALHVFHRENGLLWYRAAARGKMTPAELDAALAFADAERMVVGHTLMPEVSALYGGRLLCVDVLHEEHLRSGDLHTLIIENGEPFILYVNGQRKPLLPKPVLQHARGGQ